MNATVLVKTPTRNKAAPIVSRIAATIRRPLSEGTGEGAGKLNTFESPCSRNKSPTTMRRMLRI
jgi:hypothetical protein